MDLAELAVLVTAVGAAVGGAAMGIAKAVRWIYGEATRHCEDCCTERDVLKAANAAALEAYRKREREEIDAWRARRDGRGGEGAA